MLDKNGMNFIGRVKGARRVCQDPDSVYCQIAFIWLFMSGQTWSLFHMELHNLWFVSGDIVTFKTKHILIMNFSIDTIADNLSNDFK